MVRRIAALACALLVSCVTTVVGDGPLLTAVCCVEREITFERPWGPEEDVAVWDVQLRPTSAIAYEAGATCRLSDGVWRCNKPAYTSVSPGTKHTRGLARSTTIRVQEEISDFGQDRPGNAVITRNGIPLFAGPVPGSNAGCADLGLRVHTLTIPPPPTSTP